MNRPSSPPGAFGLFLLALLSATLLPACGGASREVRECAAPSDCGPGAHCVEGSCQASTPPSADFSPPAGLTTNRLVSVTAAARDADPGDGVASYAWTIARTTAACDADADVADAATLQAVFWCAGGYELSLVVTDATGLASEPVRRTVVVEPLAGAPTVSAGPPRAVEHRCAGTPLRCELLQPVSLSAAGQASGGGALSYHWSAIPPDASRAAAVVQLSPSADAALAALSLETDGGPISGSWRLRVRVSDGSGALAQAVQQVEVGNRPPVIDAAPLELDHRYAGGLYRVDGPLEVLVSDPDGDPVELRLSLREPAGSGCAADLGATTAGGGLYSLTCPEPAGLLAAGRALDAAATDANGAASAGAVPIRARNRTPVVRHQGGAAVTGISVPHTVGPCPGGAGSCFLASGQSPFVAEDPDGDPLTPLTVTAVVAAERTRSTGEVAADGSFRFATPVSSPEEFRGADGVGGFSLAATVADPFGASAPARLAVAVSNRPPQLRSGGGNLLFEHTYDPVSHRYLATGVIATFEDPEGDPLVDAGSTGDGVCGVTGPVAGAVGASCARAYVPVSGAPPLGAFVGSHAVATRVSDGWERVEVPATVIVANRGPHVPSFDGVVESCSCICDRYEAGTWVCAIGPYWRLDKSWVQVPVVPDDFDGDPLQVTFSSGSGLSTTEVTATPGSCGTAVRNGPFPATIQVTASDGLSQASATWTVRVSCPLAGKLCE